MDIFTTQLTRVVPVPIKKEQLKVKALVKESATSKLTDDIHHVENHDIFFDESANDNDDEQKDKNNDGEFTHHLQKAFSEHESDEQENPITEGKDGKPHLDIYI